MKGQVALLSLKCNASLLSMKNSLEQKPVYVALSSYNQPVLLVHRLSYLFSWSVVILALLAGILLLTGDFFFTRWPHAPVSAAPLLLIGAAYLGFQVLTRPQPLDLFKAFIVSSAFILWGIDQLLPTGWLATTLGDVIIVLYVIDLSWMMIDRLKQQEYIIPRKREEYAE
jgi:hypothetical protein